MKSQTIEQSLGLTPRQKRIRTVEHEIIGAISGALVGGATGSLAGMPGVAFGALTGGVIGGVAAVAIEHAIEVDSARARRLDEETGVLGGEMGAPNLDHPPAKMGLYSAASAGLGSGGGGTGGRAPSEGPMSSGDS